MFTVSERMDNDILRSESPEGDLRSASKQLRAAARVHEELAFVNAMFDKRCIYFQANNAFLVYSCFYIGTFWCLLVRVFLGEQEMAWVFVAAFTLMTGFALAPPLYRVIHGVPADDTFRCVGKRSLRRGLERENACRVEVPTITPF
jgi:hypothetical protein